MRTFTLLSLQLAKTMEKRPSKELVYYLVRPACTRQEHPPRNGLPDITSTHVTVFVPPETPQKNLEECITQLSAERSSTPQRPMTYDVFVPSATTRSTHEPTPPHQVEGSN